MRTGRSEHNIVAKRAVNPTNESATHTVETATEVGAVTATYLEGESLAGRRPSEWPWVLWERRRLLGQAAILGVVLGTSIAFLIPKRYESTTSLMPPDTRPSSGMAMMAALASASTTSKGGGSLGSLAGDLLGMKNSGELFVGILGSRTVQDRLVERFNLRHVYRAKYLQDARATLAKNTVISEERKSGIISIAVTDHDPGRAAQIARAYVEELDRLVAEVSTSSARRERIFIEQRLVKVKQDLDNASREFSEYASKNTTIDITNQGKAMVEGAARLQGELIAAQSQLEGLQQIYTANNVRVRSLRARVDELQRQLNKLGGDNTNMGPAASGTTEQFPSIRELPLLGVRWEDLYLETKIQETVYELLTQQYEVAKIEEAKEIPVVKVLDLADVPEKKSFPPRTLIGLLGMLVAVTGAATWILGKREWDVADQSNPQKAFLLEVGTSIKSDAQGLWLRSFNGRNRYANQNNGGSRSPGGAHSDNACDGEENIR